jgi:hypothetical protein
MIAGGTVALIVGAGAVALTRPGVQRALVLGQLSRTLGVPVRADGVVVGADGTVRVDGLCLLAPGVLDASNPGAPAPEAEFCRVGTVLADVDVGAVFAGGRVIRSVELRGAVVRISQHEQTGQINLAGVTLGSSGGGSLATLPGLRVEDARVELGVHGPGGYRAERVVPVRGVLGVAADNPGALEFSLEQTGGVADGTSGREIRPLERPISVRGRIDDRGVTATLDRLTLDEWTADLLPPALRPAWAALGLSGEVPGVALFVSPAGDPSVEVTLDGVGVSLPFESLGAARFGPPPPRPMRLADTRGTVRVASGGVAATLDGLFEGLRYAVDLEYLGLSAQAPFRCELVTSFRLDQEMSVFAFTPPGVMEQLERFGFPSAAVRAQVTITRATPDAPRDSATPRAGPIDVRGRLDFRDGVAAYHGFPYTFEGLEGVAEFDATTLRLTDIRGRAASGARLEAQAWFSPIGDDAEAEITIRVRDVPIDQTLTAAMRDDYRILVEQLFALDEHARLTSLGLITDRAAHARAQDRAAQLRDQMLAWSGPAFDDQRAQAQRELDAIHAAQSPVFDFGGRAEVGIRVRRALGKISVWTTEVDVALDEAGMIPASFPLPIVARDVLLRIDSQRIRLERGSFAGISGGQAEVSAGLRLVDERGIKLGRPVPDVRITAHDVPLDRLVLAALPGVRDAPPGTDGAGPADVLRRLSVRGLIDARATIGADPAGSVAYDVRADVAEASAALDGGGAEGPDIVGGPGDVTLGSINGAVRASNDRVALDLVGRTLVDGADAGAAEVSATIDRASGQSEGQVVLDPLDLAWPVESFVGLIAPQAGQRLGALRARANPSGRVTMTARVRRDGQPGQARAEVDLSDVRSLAFDADGSRVEVGAATGGALVTTHGRGAVLVDFTDLSAPVRVDGGPPAAVRLNGSVVLGDSLSTDAPGELAVTIDGARFEDTLTRLALTRATGLQGEGGAGGPAGLLDTVRPQGEYGAALTVRTGGPESRGPQASGVVMPRTLSIVRDGQRVSLGVLDGRVSFAPVPGGVVVRGESLGARTPEWRAQGDGELRRMSADGAWTLSAAGSVEALGLPADLLGLLPAPVTDGLRALSVRTQESVRVPELTIDLSGIGGDVGSFGVRGRAVMSGVEAKPGVEIEGFEGTLAFESRRDGPSAQPRTLVRVEGPRARVAGVRAAGLSAGVRTSERPGDWVVEDLAATVHGGRVTGGALVRVDGNGAGPGGGSRFAAEVQLAGVRAAPVLRDLGLGNGAGRDPTIGEGGDGWNVAGDFSRGVMDGSVSISGSTMVAEDRIGRGVLTVSGGELLELPGILNLIEASNLQVPIGSQIDAGRASFFLDGTTLVFEELSASSAQVELYGYGVMGWPSGELDLRFFSRGKRRLPVLGPVLEGLRDEIIRTRITGRPGDVRVGAEAFGGMTRPLRELAGQDDAELAQRMRDLEKRVRSGAARMQSRGSLDQDRARETEIGSVPTDE